MYSYGPPHMAVQKQDNQHEHTFSSYVRIQDIVQKTCLRQWTIGKSGERGSGISVLPARHDDDDDDLAQLSLTQFVQMNWLKHCSFWELIVGLSLAYQWYSGSNAGLWRLNELELKWHYYIHFWTNTHWEKYETPYSLNDKLNITTALGWL